MPSAMRHMIEHPSERLVQNLATAVEGAIWEFAPIRATNALLDVTADDGVVTVAGNVRSDTMRGVAGRLAWTVPGVRGVINRLVTDTDIENRAALAMALEPDLEVYTDRVGVQSILGTVSLGGVIAAPAMAGAEAKRSRVVALVGSIRGVRTVVNQIVAVEGAGDTVIAADDGSAAAAGPSDTEAKMQERMSIWRERAKAAGKL